jgi:RNA polymerase primary sigma factor
MRPDLETNPIAALTDHPLLSPADEATLIATLRAGGSDSAEARDTLVRHNMRLVVALAARFQRRAGPHLTLEDLISFGTLGLLRAVDRFDPAKAGKLSTYATWWITQAIRRGIIAEGRLITVPVHLHERRALQRRIEAQLTVHLNRPPSADEVAAALSWSPRQVAALAALDADAKSLNAPLRPDESTTERGDQIADWRYAPDTVVLATMHHHELAAVLAACLTEREQRIVRAYFGFDTGQNATLEAVGTAEGVTRERVRQVIAGALAKLREHPAIQAFRADDPA